MKNIKKNEKKLEKISCEICGSDKNKLYRKNCGFNIVKCTKCGLVYVSHQPTFKYLVNFYSTGERSEELSKQKVSYTHLVEKGHRNVVNFLASKFGKRKIKLLDIGSGLNQYDYIKKKGWEVLGTEISKTFVKTARKKGWNVIFGDVIKMKFKDNEFDAIAMMAVLEHLKSPKAYLLECRRILNDGGILIIKIPNLHYTLVNSTKLPLIYAGHLFHYTPKTIKMLLNKCGFKVIKNEPVLECGSENKIKHFIMVFWDKVSKVIYKLFGLHTNLQMVIYARKIKRKENHNEK